MAAEEEQQLDLFEKGSESRFNELTDSEQPVAEEIDAQGHEEQTLIALREAAARTPLVGDELQQEVRAHKQPEKASESAAALQLEPLRVSREAAGAGTGAMASEPQAQQVAAGKAAGAGRARAAARGMGSISQECGLEPRAGSSAGSSVKGVAAANAPSTASLSTQVSKCAIGTMTLTLTTCRSNHESIDR